MQKLIEYILSNIVEFPEEIVVEEITADNNKFNYLITVKESDIPRVIGKHGRIIKALRDIVKLSATKKNIFVDLELKNDNFNNRDAK